MNDGSPIPNFDPVEEPSTRRSELHFLNWAMTALLIAAIVIVAFAILVFVTRQM